MGIVAECNFNNYYLDNINVYELGGGVVRQLAEYVNVRLSNEPHKADLDLLWRELGDKPELRQNPELPIDRFTALDMAVRSGIQLPMKRSFRSPEYGIENIDAVIMTAGVLNWVNQGIEIIKSNVPKNIPIYVAAGTREMKTPNELADSWVQEYKKQNDKLPQEWHYAGIVVLHELLEANYEHVHFVRSNSPKGDDVATQLFKVHPDLLDQRLGVARVSSSGIHTAGQMRRAARLMMPGFDANLTDPQLFMITNGLPFSTSQEQDNQSTLFQKVQPVLRQITVAAGVLNEASRAG